jgi:predicted 3-demethylubiquinone-9 3-methyltransferase (glyoxalase superfamily)
LWVDGQAEEMANFYTSIFPNSKLGGSADYTEDSPGEAGTVMVVEFEINGRKFIALNGGPQFKFNESISLMIYCESQDEVDKYWDALLEGGSPSQCGWLKDKFGVSWQVTPVELMEMQKTKDNAQHKRVMDAMMKMVKLDIDELRKAYNGE